MTRTLRALALLAFAVTACATHEDQGLRYRMRADPVSLDPVVAGDDFSLVYVYAMFDGLVEFSPGSAEVRPAAAESWEVSPDGLTYTFRLRPGVTFHHGREVTADDVVYSIRRALSPTTESGKLGFFEALAGSIDFWDGRAAELAGVSAPDARTVVFRLQHPYGAFLNVLATEAGSIVPRDVYSDPGKAYRDRPVGSGPYRFGSWERGVSLTMTRFEGHWKPRPRSAIEKITIEFIRDPGTALEEYRAGNLDVLQELPPGRREDVRRDLSEHFHNWPKPMLYHLGFNHGAPPFKGNVTLRRAIAHAIDRDFIVRTLTEGKDTAAAGVIPAGLLGHDAGRPPIRFDLQLAARLLEEAGYPGGRGLPELVTLSVSSDSFRLIAERIQADLGRIGVTLFYKPMDPGALDAVLKSARQAVDPPFHLYLVNWFADYPDSDNFLTELFVPGRSGDYGLYDNPLVSGLIERARREPDSHERAARYREAESILMEETAIAPIYWSAQDFLLRPTYAGFRAGPLGPYAVAWEEMTRRP